MFFNLHNANFSTHSILIGAATEAFIKKTPVEKIDLKGRWESHQSLRHYVVTWRLWLASRLSDCKNHFLILQYQKTFNGELNTYINDQLFKP